MTGVNMVVDIGNGTANILQINNKKPIEEKCVTEKLGVNQYMIAVQKAVMAAYGKKIDTEVVEYFIRTGDTDAPDNYKNILLEEAENIANLKKYHLALQNIQLPNEVKQHFNKPKH